MRSRLTQITTRSVWIICLLLIGQFLLAPTSFAQDADVSLSGAAVRAPIGTDAEGRFLFPNVPLRRNAINTFQVEATDAFGNVETQEINITQISLDEIVVSSITARPLPPEEIRQLVDDGVIDLEDPENFNVSVFVLVLTIGTTPTRFEVPIVRGRNEPLGEFTPPMPDPGRPRGQRTPRIPDVAIFDFTPPSVGGFQPPSIPGVIVIEGRIKSLKEFYEVRLLLMNTSGIFTLSDVTAMIEFPEGGLSKTLPSDGIASFGDILPGAPGMPGQAEREFIIRGDEIGIRPIRVDFGGFLTGPGIPEDEPFAFNGAAETSVEVKGPPTFEVRVSHPDVVTAGEIYELTIDITNTGDAPALYASLDLDVGFAANLIECDVDASTGEPACEEVEGAVTRTFGDIFPGERVREVFDVLPFQSGPISSCTGASDQNITLEVSLGNLGCLVGTFPPIRTDTDGRPTVTVVPTPGLFGVSIEAPVTAFFSTVMNTDTISGSNFQVFDEAGEPLQGVLSFDTLIDRTVVIWQATGGTNRLPGNSELTVVIDDSMSDEDGFRLFERWESRFTTTDPIDDQDPPTITLDLDPPTDPLNVEPGELIRVNAYPQDQGSRLARVELRLQNVTEEGSPRILIDQKSVFDSTTLPCIFVIDSATLLPNNAYQVIATAFDNAGNAQDATLGIVLADGPTPPVIVLPEDPAAPIVQGISLSVTPDLVGIATQSVAYYLDDAVNPLGTVFLPPHQIAVPTSDLALGTHTLRAVAMDSMDRTAEDVLVFEVATNPSVPTIDFGGLVDGVPYVRGTPFTVFVRAEDDFGIASIEVYLDNMLGAPIASGSAPFEIDTTSLGAGPHQLIVVATNAVGGTTNPLDPANQLRFSVLEEPLGGAPPASPVISSTSVPSLVEGESPSTTISGTSVAGARIDLINTTLGTVLTTVFANAAGGFVADLDAESGDTIEVVAYDYSQSTDASSPTTVIVPTPPMLTEVVVVPGSLVFGALGEASTLTVEARFDDASTMDVSAASTYASSNVGVASVSEGGQVASVGKGTATITATYQGVTGDAVVLVDFVSLDGLSITPNQIFFDDLATTVQLSVSGLFSDGSTGPLGMPVSYTSGDPSVAIVSSSGLVTPVANGPVNLFVSAGSLIPVAVPITVDAPDPPPVLEISNPSDGTGFERDSIVSVTILGSDLGGGVQQLNLDVTGDVTFSESRQISPPQAAAVATFLFPVDSNAPLGGSFTIRATATDSNGAAAVPVSVSGTIIDETAPNVTITAPLPDAAFNFGDTINVEVSFDDSHGVTEVIVDAIGAFTAQEVVPLATAEAAGSVTVPILVPFGLTVPEVVLAATARDVAGNVGAASLVSVEITGADITPPETAAIGVINVSGEIAEVEFEVTSGLDDLDHVELYFRRDGYGTFSRYTDAPSGNPDGIFMPAAGAVGTIFFDATRMGGDGVFEFATLGVDAAGNREPLPVDEFENVVGDLGVTATINVGTVFTTISADTELPEGSNDDQNLRIDGATVTLVGAHRWQNVELLNGAMLTHPETTETAEYALDLTAWTITIDDTSSIDATARGYLGGAAGQPGRGPGQADGSALRDGGSHGGLGGDDPSVSGMPNPVYGDLTEPLTLGSGGGGPTSGGSIAGDGGGLILIGAINLIVDGAVRADGGLPSGTSQIGMGAGGGVNLRVRTLSGVGTVEADGGTLNGTNHSGGGGGRIAIRSLDRTTYAASLISARGGDGFYADGAEGTVFLLSEGEAIGSLIINGNGPGSPETNLLIPPGASFESLILQNGANVVASGALTLSGGLTLIDGSRLTHAAADESCLVVTVREVEIDSTSTIDVTARGYSGGTAGQSGLALGGLEGSGIRDGGSHGGVGGDDPSVGAQPGGVYGDPKRPTHLGGGGGGPTSGGNRAGAGGGCIRISAASYVDVDGSIRANGGLPTGTSQIGMGAGGSIWIETSRIGGIGVIEANGGTRPPPASPNHSGGGGGRVAIYYDFVDPLADLAGLRGVTAYGGDGFYSDAAPGTVYLRASSQSDGTLVADGGRTTDTWAPEATLTEIGPGTTIAVTSDSLQGDGGRAFVPNGLVGLRINPDANQTETFAISANTIDTMTVETPNENGIDFASVAAIGTTYVGDWRFDEVVLRGGVTQEFADLVTVSGNLQIVERSVLTHPHTTINPSYEPALDVVARGIEIDAESRIDVAARGYIGGRAGQSGYSVGNVASGAGLRDGGTHGGVGGDDPSVAGNPAPTYGNATDPGELGAGGNGPTSGGSQAGSGGGRVFLVADDLVVEGAIRADGGRPTGTSQIGMGAGGTINLNVGVLDGQGTIEADGGTTTVLNHSGGGGGRIAIRYSEAMPFAETNISAHSGRGFYSNGGHGSIFILRPGQMFGDYILDGGGAPNPEDSSEIPTGVTFDNVILRNSVRVVSAGGLVVDGALRLESDAVLTHAAADEGCLVISATSLSIDATSSLDVSDRGYPGGQSGGQPGTTLAGQVGSGLRDGGSYGGLGGDDRSTSGEPGPVYGDPRRPDALGSGGGAATSGGSVAGAGGGCVRVTTTNTLVMDGAIRANGGRPSGTSQIGMGSGGSVWIETVMLSGEGVIEANGGFQSPPNHSGGGGGRIAIYYDVLDPLADFDAFRDVTALGGDGFYADGAPGTVYLEEAGQSHGTLVADAGRTTDTWASEATLTEVGPGTALAVTADMLVADGGRRMLPNGLIGLRLNPDTRQSETFLISANTESTLTVETPNENGVAFASVSSAGAPYSGEWRFDEIVLRGGVSQQFADPVFVNGALDITERSLLTHPATTAEPGYEADLQVEAGSLLVELDSAIDVSLRGYRGGSAALSGFGPGNVRSGGGIRDGGSHGGLGGDDSSVGGDPASTNGSETDPRTLGSGGNGPTSGGSIAGHGGGRVRIVATGDLRLEGEIRANGGLPTGTSQIGMGAGGSVNLSADRILGNGSIFANGGTSNGTSHSGGGGGRVAIRATTANALPLENVSVAGGDGFWSDGGPGTVHVEGP